MNGLSSPLHRAHGFVKYLVRFRFLCCTTLRHGAGTSILRMKRKQQKGIILKSSSFLGIVHSKSCFLPLCTIRRTFLSYLKLLFASLGGPCGPPKGTLDDDLCHRMNRVQKPHTRPHQIYSKDNTCYSVSVLCSSELFVAKLPAPRPRVRILLSVTEKLAYMECFVRYEALGSHR